jgi:nicotinamide-nucleotide amidase
MSSNPHAGANPQAGAGQAEDSAAVWAVAAQLAAVRAAALDPAAAAELAARRGAAPEPAAARPSAARGAARDPAAAKQAAAAAEEPDPALRLFTLALRSRLTVAVAESLTGGRVAAAMTAVPGASAVLRGSVTAYATDLKARVLGVDAALLSRVGAVDAEVARQMALGVRKLCGADVGIATTGVAGPSEQDGKAVGTVYVAVVGPDPELSVVTPARFEGDRGQIQAAATRLALSSAVAHLTSWAAG